MASDYCIRDAVLGQSFLRFNLHRNTLGREGALGSKKTLAVQWLGLWALIAEGMGSISGQGTNIPQVAWCGKKKKKKTTGDLVKTQIII